MTKGQAYEFFINNKQQLSEIENVENSMKYQQLGNLLYNSKDQDKAINLQCKSLNSFKFNIKSLQDLGKVQIEKKQQKFAINVFKNYLISIKQFNLQYEYPKTSEEVEVQNQLSLLQYNTKQFKQALQQNLIGLDKCRKQTMTNSSLFYNLNLILRAEQLDEQADEIFQYLLSRQLNIGKNKLDVKLTILKDEQIFMRHDIDFSPIIKDDDMDLKFKSAAHVADLFLKSKIAQYVNDNIHLFNKIDVSKINSIESNNINDEKITFVCINQNDYDSEYINKQQKSIKKNYEYPFQFILIGNKNINQMNEIEVYNMNIIEEWSIIYLFNDKFYKIVKTDKMIIISLDYLILNNLDFFKKLKNNIHFLERKVIYRDPIENGISLDFMVIKKSILVYLKSMIDFQLNNSIIVKDQFHKPYLWMMFFLKNQEQQYLNKKLIAFNVNMIDIDYIKKNQNKSTYDLELSKDYTIIQIKNLGFIQKNFEWMNDKLN